MAAKSYKRIYLLGMMGSGKSHWSSRMGRSLGLPHFDLDKLIEEKAAMQVREIFEKKGEAFFRQLESDTLKNATEQDAFILATGGGTPCFFDNMDFMKKDGLTIWLHPSTGELMHRIKRAPGTRPILANVSSDADLYMQLEELLLKRKQWYSQADLIIEADHPQLEELVGQVQQFFNENK